MMSGSGKRIVIVAWHLPPSSEVAGKVLWRIARRLALLGARVEIIAPPTTEATSFDHQFATDLPPGLTVTRVTAWPDPVAASLQVLDNVRLRRLVPRQTGGPSSNAQPSPSGRGPLRRHILAMLRFPDLANRWIIPASRALRRSLSTEKADLVLTLSPLLSCHVVAACAGVPRETTMWFPWFHDPVSGNPFAEGSPRWSRFLAAKVEAWILARATRVVVATDELAAALKLRYPASERAAVLSCGFEQDEVPPVPPRSVGGPLVLVHMGTLYGHRSPTPVFHAIANLIQRGAMNRDALRVRLIGSDETEGEPLAAQVRRLGLEEVVSIEGPVRQSDALRLMGKASAGLLLAERQPLQVPAKTFEYLSMRLPIFALADGATARLVSGAGLGVVCSRVTLEDGLLQFISQWERGGFVEYAPAFEAAASRYNAEALAGVVLDLLRDPHQAAANDTTSTT